MIVNEGGTYKMKKILNYFLLIIFVITVSLSGIGCNKISDSSKAKDGDKSQEITLKLAWWGNDRRSDLTKKAIELFQKKQPNIKFETKIYPGTAEERNGLAMNTADEDLPDIIQMDYAFFTNYAKRDLLEPLDKYVGQNVLNISDIDKSYIEAGKYNNQIYGISLGINSYCVAVNPEIFKKANVDIPKSGYTYDELYEAAKKLKEKINDPNFYPLANFVDYNTFIRAMGYTYYDSTGTKLGYSDDSVFTEFFRIQKKLRDEGLIAPDSVTDKNSMIVSGKSAIWWGVSNNVAGLSNSAKQVMRIISVPSITSGKITSYTRQAMFFSVSAYSKHKKEAVEFIDFITNDLEVNDVLKGERGVPISAKVQESLKQKLSEADKEQYSFMDYLKEHPSISDPPTPNSGGNVASLFARMSDDVLNGKLAPEDAAKQFHTQADKILSGVKGA
jgi:multiple sugar transport system substrate-binding protein